MVMARRQYREQDLGQRVSSTKEGIHGNYEGFLTLILTVILSMGMQPQHRP